MRGACEGAGCEGAKSRGWCEGTRRKAQRAAAADGASRFDSPRPTPIYIMQYKSGFDVLDLDDCMCVWVSKIRSCARHVALAFSSPRKAAGIASGWAFRWSFRAKSTQRATTSAKMATRLTTGFSEPWLSRHFRART